MCFIYASSLFAWIISNLSFGNESFINYYYRSAYTFCVGSIFYAERARSFFYIFISYSEFVYISPYNKVVKFIWKKLINWKLTHTYTLYTVACPRINIWNLFDLIKKRHCTVASRRVGSLHLQAPRQVFHFICACWVHIWCGVVKCVGVWGDTIIRTPYYYYLRPFRKHV